MTHRTTIENAYYNRDHEAFMQELAKLQEDRLRLDHLEDCKKRMENRTLGTHRWEAFHYEIGTNTPSVREQIDKERKG